MDPTITNDLSELEVGSALVFEKSVVRLAFFRQDKVQRDGHMSGYRRRRDFRRAKT